MALDETTNAEILEAIEFFKEKSKTESYDDRRFYQLAIRALASHIQGGICIDEALPCNE